MTEKKLTFDKKIDYGLVIPVILLVTIGLVSIFISVGSDYPDRVYNTMFLQMLWLFLGCLLAVVVMRFKLSFLWRITPWLYVLGLVLMVLPLFLYSPTLVASTGAKNWVSIGSVTLFQPSEFMKISYILALARLTLWGQNRWPDPSLKDNWKLLGLYALISLPVFTLLALQSDLGTALVFVAILVGLIFVSGISWKIIIPVALAVIISIGGFLYLFTFDAGKEWLFNLGMDTYQMNRISAWLDPFSYAQNIAYQQTQALISIGSGGLLGKGFNVLELAVPVRESDMIFTVIAEDFGFIGTAVVLSLYLFLIFRMLRVTIASNNRFYTFICIGFIMMIVFHIFENIGANIGILPLTGIPLPFISQGGSSLISNLIGVGLILSVTYNRQET
ncbi:FtsW/RodA/SpoVE family cell cycle protein [Streptococcus caprae]|uniref:FtsW/RodA/SpoVE family cell cycle protein n=1 Tax=Streptococcus caprae TaxID=1640501 RepID=A0ABV8CWN3_9STRE